MLATRTLEFEEKLEISHLLRKHHTIFQTFWNIGKPIFSHSISTAAVGFDKFGHVIYLILNPDFWDSLDIVNKAFVIAHESLHVILNHGKRGLEYPDQKLVNVAQDIVINEMLFRDFGFNKYQVNGWENYCLVETVFKQEEIRDLSIHTKGSFHYYMNLLLKAGTAKETVDDHSYMQQGNSGPSDGQDNQIQSMIDGAEKSGDDLMDVMFGEIDEKLQEKEKYQFSKILEEEIKSTKSGGSPLGAYLNINPNPVKKKKKWESIVKNHVKSLMKYETVEKETWITRGRRHALLDEDLLLQGVWSEEVPKKEKYKIVFFLDSSGSCYHLKDRFVDLMKSIPEDKFEIHPFAFDGNVYPIDLKTGHVRGGGCTYFHILDQMVRKITKESRHPDAIFVVSDGDGNAFSPERPKLWHWILTPRHSLHWIPKESIKHDMKNFD